MDRPRQSQTLDDLVLNICSSRSGTSTSNAFPVHPRQAPSSCSSLSLHGMLLVISMKPPDDHGFTPNVCLCLLALIFLPFPFALSFPCLPSHPECATCDFWERTGASGAWAWDWTPNSPSCYRTVGPFLRVAESLPACLGTNIPRTQIDGSTYRSYEKTLGGAIRVYLDVFMKLSSVSDSMQAAFPHRTVASA